MGSWRVEWLVRTWGLVYPILSLAIWSENWVWKWGLNWQRWGFNQLPHDGTLGGKKGYLDNFFQTSHPDITVNAAYKATHPLLNNGFGFLCGKPKAALIWSDWGCFIIGFTTIALSLVVHHHVVLGWFFGEFKAIQPARQAWRTKHTKLLQFYGDLTTRNPTGCQY